MLAGPHQSEHRSQKPYAGNHIKQYGNLPDKGEQQWSVRRKWSNINICSYFYVL